MRKFHCLGSLSFPRWLTSTSSPNFDRSRALGLVFVGEMLCRTKERTFFLCPSQAQVAWSRGSTHDVASAFKREKIVNHFSERRRVRIPRVYYSCFFLPFTTKRDQTCRTTWKVRQWNMLQAWQCKTKDKRWDKEHPHTNTTQTICGKNTSEVAAFTKLPMSFWSSEGWWPPGTCSLPSWNCETMQRREMEGKGTTRKNSNSSGMQEHPMRASPMPMWVHIDITRFFTITPYGMVGWWTLFFDPLSRHRSSSFFAHKCALDSMLKQPKINPQDSDGWQTKECIFRGALRQQMAVSQKKIRFFL